MIVMCIVDEEVGGHDGMAKFIETDFFKALNVGWYDVDYLIAISAYIPNRM